MLDGKTGSLVLCNASGTVLAYPGAGYLSVSLYVEADHSLDGNFGGLLNTVINAPVSPVSGNFSALSVQNNF